MTDTPTKAEIKVAIEAARAKGGTPFFDLGGGLVVVKMADLLRWAVPGRRRGGRGSRDRIGAAG